MNTPLKPIKELREETARRAEAISKARFCIVRNGNVEVINTEVSEGNYSTTLQTRWLGHVLTDDEVSKLIEYFSDLGFTISKSEIPNSVYLISWKECKR